MCNFSFMFTLNHGGQIFKTNTDLLTFTAKRHILVVYKTVKYLTLNLIKRKDKIMTNKNNCDCGEPGNNLCNDNNILNPLASCFFSLPPIQFSLLSTLVGILLIDNLDTNQQNSLGNFIVGVGQTILTAAAQGILLKSNSHDENIRQQIKMLKKQLCELEQEFDK